MTINERLSQDLEELERSVRASSDIYVDVSDMLRFIAIVQTLLCDHRFVNRKPQGEIREVPVCEKCGFEQ